MARDRGPQPEDRFAQLAAFVTEAGLVYLFGGTRAVDLPNLHMHVTGRESIDEWDEETDLVWEARVELPLRGVAWFGEWLRGRGTFIAARLLPSALAWVGRSPEVEADVGQAWEISADAGMVYEAILSEGPIASMALRRAVGLDHSDAAPAYQQALKGLQRGLFITSFGHLQETGSWASSVYEPTVRAFPMHDLPDREEGLARLVDCYRAAATSPSDRGAATLFKAPVALVRSVWV